MLGGVLGQYEGRLMARASGLVVRDLLGGCY